MQRWTLDEVVLMAVEIADQQPASLLDDLATATLRVVKGCEARAYLLQSADRPDNLIGTAA